MTLFTCIVISPSCSYIVVVDLPSLDVGMTLTEKNVDCKNHTLSKCQIRVLAFKYDWLSIWRQLDAPEMFVEPLSFKKCTPVSKLTKQAYAHVSD